MRNLISTYVDQFRQDRQKQLKFAAVLAALAVIVAGVVFWQLHSQGVAMTNEVFCGQEEHVHDDGCYEQVLICDSEEEDHVHDESCFETVLTCQIPEHTHTVECLMDETADVETADVWEATLPELTGNWSQDVAAVAGSQLGYTESTANFVLADDGETHMGYTRYGAWYGNAYGDWDAMFVSFCLNYANVPANVVAENSGAYALAVSLNEQGLYIDAADFTPAAGDLVFFDENGNGQADRTGIIVNVGKNELTVIEGNSEDAVAENTYEINDSGILAFGILPDQGTPDGTENIDGDLVYAANDGGVYVSVTAPAGALPEGSELSVTLIDEDSTDYAEAADAIGLNVQTLSSDEEETGMAVIDICFLLDGREVEPAEPVIVSIDAGAILPDGAENIVIRHLEETGEGIVPVRMAELNAASPVAEFEVQSFSEFTVTWEIVTGGPADATYTLYVTAYLDGTELDDVNDLTFSSENDELDFETLLSDVNYGTGDYTFSYAIATVGNQTYGTQDNPIVAVEIETSAGGGPTGGSSNFVFIYSDGTTDSVATTNTVSISAYYLTPDFSVSIDAVDENEETESWVLKANLSHAGDDYSDISYSWTITNNDGSDNTYASIINTDNTGRVYISWAAGTPDNTEVTVSVTVTLTLEDGSTKTATAYYVLEYGDETVDLVMTYGPDKTALPAGVEVTLTSESGDHVYRGITSDDGWVHDLEIEPGVYTVTATYTDSDGNTYQCSETVALHDAGNYYINLNYYNEEILTNVPERDSWEHIDIKLSVGTTSDSDSGSVRVNITGAVIVGSDGETKYTATEGSITGNDNEFQLLFYEGTDTSGEPSHSISFDTSDTIYITYVLTIDGDEQDPITIAITRDSVYDAGTTYPVDGQRAYKIYNYLYGTNYSSNAQMIADGISDIDISGMSMMLVAAILCDSSEVTGAGQVQASSSQSANQWGMDFALSIEAMNELAASWAFNIEKTYENASMTAGSFIFYLYDAEVTDGMWTLGSLQSTLTNSEAGMDAYGNSHDTMEAFSIAYSDEAIQNGETYYYILYEEPDTFRSQSGATITFDSTVFGVMVQLGTDSDGEATVTATYYRLEWDEDSSAYRIADTYTTGTSVDGKITFDSDDYATFEFTNNYQNYVAIEGEKEWVGDTASVRPESITIYLLQDGERVYDDEGNAVSVTVEPDDDGNWTWSFTGLPEYKDGLTRYTYSVEEEIVPGYSTDVTANTDDDGEPDGTYTITNTYTETVPLDIFKYDTSGTIWMSTTTTRQGPDTASDPYYLRYTDAEGTSYYATVADPNAAGTLEDPIVVTGWTEDQSSAWYVEVSPNQSVTYYFTGEIGNIDCYFEFTGTEGFEEDDPITMVANTGNGLEGAQFILSKTEMVEDDEGEREVTYYALAEPVTDDNGNIYYQIIEWVNDINSATPLVSGADGYIHVGLTDTDEDENEYCTGGLDPGTYTLIEIQPPTGYAVLIDEITFEIDADGVITIDDGKFSEIEVGNEAAVYSVNIIKYAGEADNNPVYLENAVFTLRDSDNNYAVFEYDVETGYTVTGWTGNEEEAGTVTSGPDGTIHIEGLYAGDYILTETAAPDGYNMLTDPISFTIEADGSITGDDLTWINGAIGVANTTSAQLPNTGGIGTWIYTAAGLVLIGGAASLLVYRKRRAVRS